jgi:hypothetical protein
MVKALHLTMLDKMFNTFMIHGDNGERVDALQFIQQVCDRVQGNA